MRRTPLGSSSGWCETATAAAPLAHASSTAASIQSREAASSPASGSSRRSAAGRGASARARSSLRSSPYERERRCRRARGAIPSRASTAAAAARSPGLGSSARPIVPAKPERTTSSPVASKRCRAWSSGETRPTRPRSSSALACGPRSRRVMVPRAGCSSPARRRRRVDFPAPFGPTSASCSPGATEKDRIAEHGPALDEDGDGGEGEEGRGSTGLGSRASGETP